MKKLLAPIIILSCTTLNAQLSPSQEQLSTYYKLSDSLYRQEQFDQAIQYLDSSSKAFGTDSLELAYNWLLRARIYEATEVMDSVNYYYDLLDPLARRLSNKEPLRMSLVLKGYLLLKNRNLAESDKLIQEGLTMWSKNDYMGSYYLGLAYKALGEAFILRNQFDSAYQMIEQMNDYANQDKSGKLLPTTYRTNSWLYFRLGDFEKAIETIKIPFESQKMNLNNLGPSGSVIAGNIALNYMMLGDYERAEEYILAVTEMHRKNGQTETYGFYQNMLFLAACYLDMQAYDKALAASNEQLNAYLAQNTEFRTPYYYSSLKTKGRALAGLKRKAEAEKIFEEVIAYQKTLENSLAPLLRTYLEVGMANIVLEQYEEALKYLFKSLELQRATDQLKGPDAIPIMGNIADAYFGLKSYDQAMVYMDSSLLMNQYFVPYESNKPMRYRAVRWQLELLNSKLGFLREMWDEKPTDEIMLSAISVIEQTNTTIDQARKAIRGDNSRLEIAYDFYDHAVFFYAEKYESSNDPDDLRMAFSFSENNKSFLLNEISGESSVSDDKNYQELLAEKARLKSMVSIESIKEGSTQLYNFFDSLDFVQKEIDRFSQYDHFRQLSPSDLNTLSGNTVWTMHIGEDCIYSFLLNEGSLSYAKVSIDSTFQEEVKRMRKALSDPSMPVSQLSIVDEMTHAIKKVNTERLIIIPDGMLNYIPFELFTYSRDSMLMDKFNINYRNSLFQLLDNRIFDYSSALDLISFAPDFGAADFLSSQDVVRNEMSSIPGAFDEVNNISRLFNGKMYIREDATESNFKTAANEYGIIHLATHALVDDKDPKQSRLIFNLADDTLNDGYLHVHEIASLELKAQLATLSACNTGFGKIKKGEGVISLSRAFAYAGVPATVVSLWPASDKSTPELMKYFYQNLKEGQPKDEALNNARKQYLASATGKARHPFYWGGFVLIGDNSPIEEDRNLLVWVLPILIILVLIGTVLRRRKRQ